MMTRRWLLGLFGPALLMAGAAPVQARAQGATEPVDVTTELKALRMEMEELKSKDQIRQQIVRYARALEWRDPDLFREVFHEDAHVDFGFFKGKFADYWSDTLVRQRSKDATLHVCTTTQIALQGEIADVESYGIATARVGEQLSIFGGRYFDTFDRRGGVWRIARRVFALDWNMEYRGEGPADDLYSKVNFIRDRSANNPLFRRLAVASTS